MPIIFSWSAHTILIYLNASKRRSANGLEVTDVARYRDVIGKVKGIVP
jgi:hypothetical protein